MTAARLGLSFESRLALCREYVVRTVVHCNLSTIQCTEITKCF